MLSLSSTGGGFAGIMRRTIGLARAGRGVTSKSFSASDGSTPSWRSRATMRQTAERERCRRSAIWCHRPQADQPADFFVGPERHGWCNAR